MVKCSFISGRVNIWSNSDKKLKITKQTVKNFSVSGHFRPKSSRTNNHHRYCGAPSAQSEVRHTGIVNFLLGRSKTTEPSAKRL